MSLSDQAYEIIGDWIDNCEDEILLELRDVWPNEYTKALNAEKLDDPDRDAESPPNLSVLCEQISKSMAAKFLESLKIIVNNLAAKHS